MAFNRLLLCRMRRWSSALLVVALLTGCGGSGGGPKTLNPNDPPPAPGPGPGPAPGPGTVTVSGAITFDRIPFDSTPGGGLNPSAPVESPARGIVVEAISGGSAVATATTNASGEYLLTVASNTDIFIRAKAQMLKTGAAPTWNFRVLNNTNSDALYVLDGSTFNTGTANVTRNLRATSGWSGTSYSQTRAAAPFAVLDTVYQAVGLITSAASAVAFDPLDLFWSADNRSAAGVVCYDDGNIQTTSYISGVGPQDLDDCGDPMLSGIYVLGSVQQGSNGAVGDTDEFDQHVIAHEFGHYVEDKFSRSDSIGGTHDGGDRLDLRLAFGEGWGNAFSGMVLNNPLYRDSYSVASNEFGFNMEADDATAEGWFSEGSVMEILWDLFDTANDGENVALGFAPILQALNSGQRTTPALTSIFSFVDALRDVAPGQGAGITQLLSGESISGTDEFGANENNNGGNARFLPIYETLTLNSSPQSVCVTALASGRQNTLGYRKFFRLDLPANAIVTINAVGFAGTGGPAAEDPDIYVHRNGSLVAFGISEGTPNETISQQALTAGTYIVEVYDYELDVVQPTKCITVSATGV